MCFVLLAHTPGYCFKHTKQQPPCACGNATLAFVRYVRGTDGGSSAGLATSSSQLDRAILSTWYVCITGWPPISTDAVERASEQAQAKRDAVYTTPCSFSLFSLRRASRRVLVAVTKERLLKWKQGEVEAELSRAEPRSAHVLVAKGMLAYRLYACVCKYEDRQ